MKICIFFILLACVKTVISKDHKNACAYIKPVRQNRVLLLNALVDFRVVNVRPVHQTVACTLAAAC